MPKRSLLLFLTTIGLMATSLLVVYSIRTQRQEIRKQAAEEFKSLYFTAVDESVPPVVIYEAIMSYKFEYPKFIWRFDKLTCTNDKTLVQRRFLHIGKTMDEVAREGWIDQSVFQWSLGDPLPSGEVNILLDKGCFFQLDATMTVKPKFGQTKDETNGINKSDKGTISGCGQIQPSLTPTLTPTVVPSIQPTPTPVRNVSLTPTQTPSPKPTSSLISTPTATKAISPSVTPIPSVGPSPTASVTPINSPIPTLTPTSAPQPTATNQPGPTSTNAPAPTNTITVAQKTVESTPTEAQLPSAGIKLPTLFGIIAGFLLISIGLAFVF